MKTRIMCIVHIIFFIVLCDIIIQGQARIMESQSDQVLPQWNMTGIPGISVSNDDFIFDKVSQSDRIDVDLKSSTEIVIKDTGHLSWVELPKQFFTPRKKRLRQPSITPTQPELKRPTDSQIIGHNTKLNFNNSRGYHYNFYPIL